MNSAEAESPDYRVLKRLGPMERNELRGVRPDMLVGLALDVETTGLDPQRDSIVELALQRFRADAGGKIVATGLRHSWLEDPQVEITKEITHLTGIRPDDVIGRTIIDR